MLIAIYRLVAGDGLPAVYSLTAIYCGRAINSLVFINGFRAFDMGITADGRGASYGLIFVNCLAAVDVRIAFDCAVAICCRRTSGMLIAIYRLVSGDGLPAVYSLTAINNRGTVDSLIAFSSCIAFKRGISFNS